MESENEEDTSLSEKTPSPEERGKTENTENPDTDS